MNPYTGEIQEFQRIAGKPEKTIPRGWIALTDEEAKELVLLDPDDRLLRYIMVLHRLDKCKACGCFLFSHSLTRFKECAATELAQFDIENLASRELTDAQVDAFLEEHKDDPVDEASLERMRALFKAKLEAEKLAEALSAPAR